MEENPGIIHHYLLEPQVCFVLSFLQCGCCTFQWGIKAEVLFFFPCNLCKSGMIRAVPNDIGARRFPARDLILNVLL